MKNLKAMMIGVTFFTVTLTNTAHAEHDNGLGKSQDGQGTHLESISVAPEPSTFWLFLAGTAMIAAYSLRKKKIP
jgi:hypothetical protein